MIKLKMKLGLSMEYKLQKQKHRLNSFKDTEHAIKWSEVKSYMVRV